MTNTAIVLAMHGSPPLDFPQDELVELFAMHMRLEHQALDDEQRAYLERRHAALDTKIRNWKRTPQNDPFFAASMALAEHLSGATGSSVLVGFNEFCSPTLEDALDGIISISWGKSRAEWHSALHYPGLLR